MIMKLFDVQDNVVMLLVGTLIPNVKNLIAKTVLKNFAQNALKRLMKIIVKRSQVLLRDVKCVVI
jgi:hypothetical protein